MIVLAAASLVTPLVVAPTSPAHAAQAADCALPGPSGWATAEHEGMTTDYTGRWRDPIGTHRVIALFVDFEDAEGDAGVREALRNSFAPAVDWFDTSSRGRTALDVTWGPQWHRMPQPSGYYHDFDPDKAVTSTFPLHKRLMQDAVTAADPLVDFSGYDFVHVIVPPPLLYSPNYRSAAYIALAGNPADHLRSTEGSIRLGATLGWGIDHVHRLFVHETSHLFGLPDLYSYTVGGDAGLASIGGWDLMGATRGSAPDLLAWHKWKLGWLDDSQVYCLPTNLQTATRTLTPLHTTGGAKMAVLRTEPNRAVVVEYRAAGGPIDGAPEQVQSPECFRPGVLVYTVDADKVGGQQPIRVIDAHPNSDTGAGCHPALRQLDDATLVSLNQEVVDPQSGTRIRLTGTGDGTRTVRVTRP
ncbi:hypothetical protein O7626_17575 [Micromonospora sp. WMMD1102]|uniref:hypothetical protein n=1 Tax=Micromonospora sp. WMMD1102 TaxID=3016105 RepID=UPI002414EF56|nr:hypothetical protein [Micromonospora sp. WMMD1102]MDG4787726.1 hypothetical protein [Micromonospora sp. WMMD1102]